MIEEPGILAILDVIPEPVVFICSDATDYFLAYPNCRFSGSYGCFFVKEEPGQSGNARLNAALKKHFENCCHEMVRIKTPTRDIQINTNPLNPDAGENVSFHISLLNLTRSGHGWFWLKPLGKFANPDKDEHLQSSERFHAAQRIAGIGLWEYDFTTGDIYWSSEIYKMWEVAPESDPYTLEEFLRKIHPDDRPVFEQYMKSVADGSYSKSLEYRMITPSLKTVYMRQELQLYRNRDNEPILLRGVVMDITVHKLANKELTALNRRYHSLISNVPGITYRCLPDEQWTMLFISQEVERMTGYSPDKFTNGEISFASIIFEEDTEADLAFIESELDRKGAFLVDYRIRCADGRTLWVEDRGLGIYHDNGELAYIDGVILDVTEKRYFNEKYRSVFNKSNNCMLVLGADGEIKEYNTSAKRLLETVRRAACLDDLVFIKDNRDAEAIPLFQWLNDNMPAPGIIYEFQRKNASSFFGEIEFLKNIDPETNLLAITDVTFRKAQEEILMNSERRFKALIQEGGDVVFILNRSGRLSFASDNVEKVLDVSPGEITGTSIYRYLHKDDHLQFEERLQSLSDHQKIHLPPYRIMRPEGKWVWFSSILTNLESEPSVNGIIVNSMNITDQVEYAEKLLNANERFVQVLRTSNEAICDWDIVHDKVFWGQGFQEIFGFDLSRYNNNLWSDNIHPDDKEYVLKKIDQALSDPLAEKFFASYRFIRADGSIALIEHRATFTRDESGKAIRGIGAFRDVTELKESLLKLKLRNEQLEKITWIQSHLVRAPLAKIMCLVDLLALQDKTTGISDSEIIDGIIDASLELDQIIRKIIKQSELLKEL